MSAHEGPRELNCAHEHSLVFVNAHGAMKPHFCLLVADNEHS